MTKAYNTAHTTNLTLLDDTLTAPTESWNIVASALSSTATNIDCLTSGVWYYTVAATATFGFNFRGNSTTTLASVLAVGQAVTINVLNTSGATAYYPTTFTVDGTSVTPKWSGGTAPTAGNVSTTDTYSFTIVKTAATPTYIILASGPIKYT
jgi:hypothetical protein